MDSVVLAPLDSLESHLNSLITSFTQTNTFTNAPQIARDLVSDDDNLTASLNLLQRHQQNYARILNLRAEVVNLQEQLRDTIRQCVALRQEIGHIHPSILDSLDSDGDDAEADQDTDSKVAEVDYRTLLSFAARIGKHNAAAAREAEAEAIRRKIAARKKTPTTTTTTNGVGPDSVGGKGDANENATAETEAELERINNTIALTRAQMGMAFPDANLLRVGALGQLQLLQERQQHTASTGGDGGDAEAQAAIDREVERLVRETEDIAEPEHEADVPEEEHREWPSPEMSRRSIGGDGRPSGSQARGSIAAHAPAPSQQPKRKLDLDFPSSEDEE
ncbi:hypothetical protein ABEF93_005679 [Exophiala dermatitidis]